MRQFQKKRCLNCAYPYTPVGSSSKFCNTECRNEFHRPARRIEMQERRRRAGKLVGVGKGGAPHSGALNPMWKGGIVLTQDRKQKIKKEVRYCEKCGKDLLNTTHYQWVVHHKNKDKTKNNRSNLQLLCKSCHQIEHKCWEAFEGATTIP